MDNTQEVKVKKRGKGCLLPIIIVVAVTVAFIVLAVVLSLTVGKETTKNNVTEMQTVMGITQEQENNMLAIFEQCNIGKIVSVEAFQSGETHSAYHLKDEETSAYSGASGTIVVWLFNDTKEIEAIYYKDCDIYKDGAVITKIDTLYVPSGLRDTYRTAAQMLVNRCLEYPDNAKYESKSGWRFGVIDGLDVCQSTVEAQNAFGVKNTISFTVKFNRETGSAVSLIVDGKEYIK